MLKKIRRFYKNNRIYCILMIVSFLCLVVLGSALVIYFVNQMNSDKYGSRMDEKDTKVIKEEMKSAEKFIEEFDYVLDADVFRQGPIVYLQVEVEKETSLANMQSLGTESLAEFSEESLKDFELQFSFQREGKVSYEGSKPTSNTIISWSRYNIMEETTTTTKKKK